MRRRVIASAGVALTLVACNAILGLDGDTVIGGSLDATADAPIDVALRDVTNGGDVGTPGVDAGRPDATIDAGGENAPLGIRRVVGDFGGAGYIDGPADIARFTALGSVQVDPAGNRYVIDGLTAIRKIDPSGNVTTLAGKLGEAGVIDGKADVARFTQLTALALDPSGTLYALEGQGTCRIRAIALSDVTVTTIIGKSSCLSGGLEGTGNDARFNAPTGMTLGVAAASSGSIDTPVLFVADPPAMYTVEIATQKVTYGCGKPGTPGPGSCKDHPINAFDLAFAKDGLLYYRQADRVFRYLPPTGDLQQLTGPLLPSDVDAGLTGASFLDFGLAVDGKTLVVGSRTQLFAGALDTSSLTTLASDFAGIGGVALVGAGRYEIADHTALLGFAQNTLAPLAGRKRALGYLDSPDGTLARIGSATSFASDAQGRVYFFDPENAKLRTYDPTTSKVGTLGSTSASAGGDGIVFDGTQLLFSNTTGKGGAPHVQSVDLQTGVFTTLTSDFGLGSAFTSDRKGTVYATSTTKSPTQIAVIAWKPGEPNSRIVVAGNEAAAGYVDGTGGDARFGFIGGLCLDESLDALIVADAGNVTVRKIDLTTKVVSRIAGDPGESIYVNGASARFASLDRIACDGNGFAFVSDAANATVRRIDLRTGFVDEVAGVRGQQGMRAGAPGGLNQPLVPFVLPNGHLLVGSANESVIVDVRVAKPL